MPRPYPTLLTLFILAGTWLGACSGTAATNTAPVTDKIQPAPTNVVEIPAASTLSALYVPPYYTANYAKIVAGSKNEGGLVIYTELSSENWQPVINAFNSHYPWIKVSLITLGASEVFDRYNTEVDEGSATADLLVSTDITAWNELLLSSVILAYHSQEDVFLPLWATKSVYAGLYPMSTDPAFIVYNKNMVSHPPTSLRELGSLITKTPAEYKGKIITYDVETDQTGFALNWFWIKAWQESGWEILSQISQAQPLMTASKKEIIDALTAGEAEIGYFVPSTLIMHKLSQYPTLGYSYISDGQPIFLHYMAIPASAKRQNSAKLMLDFLLSQEGQVAIAEGGMTPYRTDIAAVAKNHLDKLATTLGITNLIFVEIDPELMINAKKAAILERWRTTFNRAPPPQ